MPLILGWLGGFVLQAVAAEPDPGDAAGGGAPADDGDGLPAVHVLHGDRPGHDARRAPRVSSLFGGVGGRGLRSADAVARGVRPVLLAAGRLLAPGLGLALLAVAARSRSRRMRSRPVPARGRRSRPSAVLEVAE